MLNSLTTQTARDILRLAFRVSYLKSFEGLKATFDAAEAPLEYEELTSDGFFTHVPLIAGCALQVQLEQLIQTWRRLSSGEGEVSDVDHCVCYCAASHLAELSEMEDQRSVRIAAEGIASLKSMDWLWLTSKLRILQITWPFAADSGVVVRDNYLADASLDVVAQRPIERCRQTDALLDLVGRWTVSAEILTDHCGLLTDAEFAMLSDFFGRHPKLID